MWNVASCWLYSANILAMHRHTNVKVTRCYCCYYGLLSHVCGGGELIIYADPDIHVKLSAKNSKFHTPEIFHNSWLTNNIRIQFVDIFVSLPHNKVHISNNMTLRSHVCIILNYPACYHAKNKINNSLESNVTLRWIYQFITSHDNKSQFCGAKLCNYNGHIKAITIKYHDRMFLFCSNCPVCKLHLRGAILRVRSSSVPKALLDLKHLCT